MGFVNMFPSWPPCSICNEPCFIELGIERDSKKAANRKPQMLEVYCFRSQMNQALGDRNLVLH